MQTSDFDYDLPPGLIAQVPAAERTASRMLVVHRASGVLEHRGIRDIGAFLRPNDVLVLNDTRVIPARLLGRRMDTGGRVEVFLLEPAGAGSWLALYRASGRRRAGLELALGDEHILATITQVLPGGQIEVALRAREGELGAALEAHGRVPVPPYIHRDDGDAEQARLDHARYQTVYARAPGAVAAPTAGLHFSETLLAELAEQGVRVAKVTLHVGPGTFKPVQAEQLEGHTMEAERYEVSAEAAETIRDARAAGGRVVAVGSTSVRTLETMARDHGDIRACAGRSTLFIYPPYGFRVVDAMLTNFHLPRSTLLMMVSAFAGVQPAGGAAGAPGAGLSLARAAYAQAMREHYRFYSYGDCMLLL